MGEARRRKQSGLRPRQWYREGQGRSPGDDVGGDGGKGGAKLRNDLVVSVFRLTNARFLVVPKLDFNYVEQETGVRWHITAGGSRAYTLRFGAGLAAFDGESIDGQNADSHFMMSRVQGALLLGGSGLFQAEAVGRVFLEAVQDNPNWFTQADFPVADPPEAPPAFYDWLGALIRHTMLRRAAADAHAALSHPHEAGSYVYRGFEWLVVGEGRSWDDLASDVGVSKAEVRNFKKLANVDHGVRHASRSGVKLRADVQNYGTWVCGLIDAINATRARLESGFTAAAPEVVAEAVGRAASPMAYQ